MHTRVIQGQEVRERYRAAYEERTGNRIDDAYLAKAFARGFYDGRGTLVGGYLLNTHRPFRCLLPLSAEQQSAIERDRGISFDDACEISCMWLDPERIGFLSRFAVYLFQALDVTRAGRRWIIAGTHEYKLMRIHTDTSLPRVLFHDRLFVRSCGRELPFWLYAGSRPQMILGVLRGIVFRLMHRRHVP